MGVRTKLGRRRRGYTRLSSKRQVTVPLEVANELRLNPGDELRVEVDDGKIVLIPELSLRERRVKAIEETAGSLTGVWPPGALDRLRDEWR
jgi:AbrB family looped-hinge helix DNA binding protein